MKACKFCGTVVENTKRKCPECGSTELLHVCENCGEHFDGNFCPKCGVKIGQKGKTCPECQTVYFSNACPNCGYTPLRKTTTEQTVIHKHVYVTPPQTQATSSAKPAATSTQQKTVKKKKSKWRWLLYFLAFCAVVSLFRGGGSKDSTKKSTATKAPSVTATVNKETVTATPVPTQKNQADEVIAVASTEKATTAPTEEPTEAITEEPTTEPMDEMTALQAFYDDYSANGSEDNIKEIAEKYGLYADYYNTGTGTHKYKVAATKKGAEAWSLSCFGQEGNYVEVDIPLFGNKDVTIRFNKESDYIKPEGDHYDESLKGRGSADSGRSEPQYVGVIGYVAQYRTEAYNKIEESKDFRDESVWVVPTYERDKQFWNEVGSLPHKTEVVVREQILAHEGYGAYSGYLLVERTDDKSQYYINVMNFITKPYWTYQTDLTAAALVGYYIAEYKQVSDYYPVSSGGKKADLKDGTIVLVKGKAGLSRYVHPSETDIEAVVWKKGGGGSTYYFNHEDLSIIY